MEGNRESLIQIKCEGFKESDVKFQVALRMDFGKAQCSERTKAIEALGITPGANAVTVVHEFVSNDAAAAFVTKLNEFKAGMGASMLGPHIGLIESIRAEGPKVIACVRAPAEVIAQLAILDMAAGTMGDFADKHQYVEFKISDSHTLKDIFTDEKTSPLAVALEALCIRLTLSLNKDLPIKIADCICQLIPGPQQDQIKLIGSSIATFHHIRLEMELREPNEAMKQIAKDQIMMGLMSASQMVLGMAQQFGFADVIKNGGSKTTAMLVLSPILSFEFSILAPTALETLEKAMQGPGMPPM